jgi:xylulokinase
MCYCSISANVLQWYRDTHAPDLSFGELDAMAAKVPPGAAGLAAEVPPDTPDGSCTFRGERPEHRVGHYVRSILEAVAEALRELAVALRGDAACDEPSLLGAAMTAAVGVGALPDWQAAAREWSRVERTFVPGNDASGQSIGKGLADRRRIT